MEKIIANLDQILPIVIFIIIAIFSSLGRKKRGEGEDTLPEPEESSSGDYEFELKEGSEVDGKLRGVLEDIFQSKKPQPAKSPSSHIDFDVSKQKKLAERRIKAKAAAKSIDAAVTSAYAQQAPAPTAAPETAYDILTPESESALTASARTGIIWAEILNRPLAMR